MAPPPMVLSPLVTNYENALQLDLIFSTEHPSSLMTLSLCQIDTQNQPVQYINLTCRFANLCLCNGNSGSAAEYRDFSLGVMIRHLGGTYVWASSRCWDRDWCGWVWRATAACQVELVVSSCCSSSEAFGRKAATTWEFPTQALAEGACVRNS